MKFLLALAALFAFALFAAPVQASGFHDDPAVPNCSILDQASGCEWVATPVGKSIAPIGHGHQACSGDAVWTREGGYWHCVCV